MIERLGGPGLGCAQELFELGPCFFDGIEVGRVWRQVEQLSSGSRDPLPNASHFVRAEVVHDHDIAWPQHGAEDVVQVGEEDLGVGGRLDSHGGDHAAKAHRT